MDARTGLHYQTHFTIKADTSINTPKGLQKYSTIEVVQNNNAVAGPKLLNGMQQCLLAELNRKREQALVNKKNPAGNEALYEQLRQCKCEFYIPPESQVSYSSTNKSLIDDYDEGDVYTVTASPGSRIEKTEAAKLYGKRLSSGIKESMEFITVPDHVESKRIVNPVILAKDEKDQLAILVEEIIAAHRKTPKQGLLIFCENDIASEKMQLEVKKLLSEANVTIADEYYNYIPNRTSHGKEASLIEKASLPGMLTFTTDKEGRGADFNLPNGKAIIMYPSSSKRGEIQIHGRIGRYGSCGEVQEIFTKAQLSALRAKGTDDSHDSIFSRAGLFIESSVNFEAHIEQQQVLAERREQCKRLIRNTIGDYQKKHTNAFYEMYNRCPDPSRKEELKQYWCDYSAEADRYWNTVSWPQLNAIVEQSPKPDLKQIQGVFEDYQNKIQPLWHDLKKKISELGIKRYENSDPLYVNNIALTLPRKVANLEFDGVTKQLMQDFELKQSCRLSSTVKVYRDYNPALAGRAAVYSSLPWERGKVPFFANTRAAWNGKGMIFADSIATATFKRPICASMRAIWNERRKGLGSSEETGQNNHGNRMG